MKRYTILKLEKSLNLKPYVWKGIILKKYGGEIDDIFYCHLYGEDATKVNLKKGDIVDADLVINNYVPDKDYDYSDFVVNKIRFISKSSWIKIK